MPTTRVSVNLFRYCRLPRRHGYPTLHYTTPHDGSGGDGSVLKRLTTLSNGSVDTEAELAHQRISMRAELAVGHLSLEDVEKHLVIALKARKR